MRYIAAHPAPSPVVCDCVWTQLAMTNEEFHGICKPFLCREPTGPGQPPAMVQYRKFAVELQRYADQHLTDEDMAYAMSLRHAK